MRQSTDNTKDTFEIVLKIETHCGEPNGTWSMGALGNTIFSLSVRCPSQIFHISMESVTMVTHNRKNVQGGA